nr:endoribonuclease YbeY isoform X3 [Chelonoidis abingdonii]
MSLVIRNLQKVIPLRRIPLRRRIEILQKILDVQQFDLGIICVSNRNIQLLNNTYRQKNVPTDVLSFPFHENLKAGELPQPNFQDEYNLGDVFLGVEYIYQQCQENGEDFYSILTTGDCSSWTVPFAGIPAQHRSGVGADVSEGKTNS